MRRLFKSNTYNSTNIKNTKPIFKTKIKNIYVSIKNIKFKFLKNKKIKATNIHDLKEEEKLQSDIQELIEK